MKQFSITFVLVFVMNMISLEALCDNNHLIDGTDDTKPVYAAKVEIDGTAALIDIDGNYIIPPGKYTSILWADGNYKFKDGIDVVRNKDNKEGFVDFSGKEVIPCNWQWLSPFKHGLAGISQIDQAGYQRHGFINRKGEVVVPCYYSEVEIYEELGLIMIKRDGKEGLVDYEGKEVYPMELFSIIYDSGVLHCSKDGNKSFLVDRFGKVVSDSYEHIERFSDGYATITKQGSDRKEYHGYIDTAGKEYIIGKYEANLPFSNGFAVVKQNNKYGIINTMFEETIPCIYDDIRNIRPIGYGQQNRNSLFINGLVQAKKNDKWGIINTKGEIIIPFDKKNQFQLKNDVILYKAENDEYQLFSLDGTLLSNTYKSVENFSDEYALVKQGSLCGIIDRRGNEVLHCEYDALYTIKRHDDDLIRAKKNGKWGLLGKDGQIMVEFLYDGIGILSNGLIRVKKGEEWGHLDKNNQFVLDPKIDKIESFRDGLARIRTKGKLGFVDNDMNIVIPVKYYDRADSPLEFHYNRYPVYLHTENGWKWGYINQQGELVIPCIFDKASSFERIDN